MADEKVTTILQVELDAAKVAEDLTELSRKIALVKDEQKQLDEEYKSGKISLTEYTKSTAAMKDELTWLQKQQKGVIATTKLLTQTDETYSNTLNGQRQKLADMLKAYDQLDATIRDSKAGRKFKKEIEEQTEAVSKLEKETGRAQRNVGNYAGALEQAGVGVGGFTKRMKALWANPWAAIIGAVVLAFKKLIDAFKGSEERMNEMRKGFAPLKASIDVVQQVFDALAKSLSGVVQTALAKVTEGVKWLFAAIDKLGKKIGKDWGLSEAFESAAENTKKATDAAVKYEKARRSLVTFAATTEQQVAELRAKAAEKEKYSFEERVRFLEEAKDKELALANEKKRVAELNLTALQAEARNTENSAEMNDRLAEAKADVIRATTEYYNTQRMLSKQILGIEKEEEKAEKKQDATTKASLDYRLQLQLNALGKDKELSEEAYRIRMDYFRDVLALYDEDAKEYFDTLKQKEQYEKEYQEKRLDYERKAADFLAANNAWTEAVQSEKDDLEKLQAFYSQGVLSFEQYERAKTDIARKYQKERADLVLTELGALAGSFDAMAGMLGEFAEENEEAAKAQKAFSFMSILLSEAQSIAQGALAISEGVASAASIPFPANIPAILSVVATIASLLAGVGTSIAQSKQIFAQADAGNFSGGGTVGGSSYTGDKLIAHVNSGEGIYNGTQANNLLQEIANNPLRGGATDALMEAMRNQPAPVLVLKELREFEEKVTTFDELASI